MTAMQRATTTLLVVAALNGSGCDQERTYAGGPGAEPAVYGCSRPRLDVVQGADATALAGATVPELGVRLRCPNGYDDNERNVRGRTIDWRVLSGGGTVRGAAATQDTTDLSGYSGTTWTLGPVLGVQSVEAAFTFVDYPEGEHHPEDQVHRVVFRATALAPGPCDPATGTDHGDGTTFINASEVWTAAASPHRGHAIVIGNSATLRIEPGAVVCVERIEAEFVAPGQLVAEGTAQAPIRLVGRGTTTPTPWMGIRAAASLKHVRVEDAINIDLTRASTTLVSTIEDSSFVLSAELPGTCPQLLMRADNGATGQIRRTTIRGYGSTSCAALHASAALNSSLIVEARIVNALSDGVLVGGAGSVTLTNCEITGNGGHGVVVFAPGSPPQNPTLIRVNHCNLTGNVGAGVSSPTATIGIDATDNWWGDGDGPTGSSGDGATGMIIASPWRTAPVTLGY